MSAQLEIPCLGRPFDLGMLYDCRSEKVIPGITLWDAKKLESFSKVKTQPSTTFEVIAEDSINEKTSSLGVNADLKLSLMSGLLSVEGAAKFLHDEKSSEKQSRVTLQYKSTTHFKQLTMDQIGDIQFPKVLADQDATHVVTGITYGADAFFVFDRAVSEKENLTDVHGDMKISVAKIPMLSGSISGGAGLDYKDVDRSMTDKFQCKFYGDVLLDSNPSTFEDAIKLYCDLPKLLNGEAGSVPKLVYLSPLSKLGGGKAQKIVRSISDDLISQVEEVMEKIHSIQMRIHDLLKHEMCSKFVDIKNQLSKNATLLSRFKMKFVKELSDVLPRIRSTGAEEKELADLISSVDASPFSPNEMDQFLKRKDQEIKTLQQYLKNLEKEGFIQFDFPDDTSCDLSTLTVDDQFEYVVCFAFNVTSESSAYTKALESYLQKGEAKPAKYAEWMSNQRVTKALRAKTNKFLKFAKENSDSKNTAFVVTSFNQETGERGPAIILYNEGEPLSFDPPGLPGTPTVTAKTKDSIAIEWAMPKTGIIDSYTVVYRTCGDTKYITTDIEDAENTTHTFKDLTPSTEYEIHIRAISDSGYPTKSEAIVVKTDKDALLAESFLKYSTRICPKCDRDVNKSKECKREKKKEKDSWPPSPPPPHPDVYSIKPALYKVPMQLVASCVEEKDAGLYKYEVGPPPSENKPNKTESSQTKSADVRPEKVLMVVGATGAGKSTLINGIANYVLGVTWKDDYRFKLITDEGSGSQANSQTRNITAYSMRNTALEFDLTIIDTPGFGDTEGIERDRRITKQIKKFFSQGNDCSVDQLHGIGFVTQAALPRLTPTQKYIFDSILSIFGKDIGENIFLMVTFADGGPPTVLDGVQAAEIKYQESFKFNNSALFAASSGSSDQSFDAMFWKMGYSSFENFFTHFSRAEARSLALTREVLKEREQLETLIPGLQNQVRIGMLQMNEIQRDEDILKQFEVQLNANENFTYEVPVTKFRKTPLKSGIHTTTCQKCNFTCHENCAIPNDEKKAGCWAMSNGKCRVCPEKCEWNLHSNVPFIFEYYQDVETHTSDELKAKYLDAQSGKQKAEAMMKKNEEDLINMQVEVYILIEQVQKSIKRLEEIALKPNPLNELQYLDLLIESEKQEAKFGWESRVEQYTKFRKDAELYHKVATSGTESLELIKGSAKAKLSKQVEKYLEIRKRAAEQNVPTQSWWGKAKGYVKKKLGYDQ